MNLTSKDLLDAAGCCYQEASRCRQSAANTSDDRLNKSADNWTRLGNKFKIAGDHVAREVGQQVLHIRLTNAAQVIQEGGLHESIPHLMREAAEELRKRPKSYDSTIARMAGNIAPEVLRAIDRSHDQRDPLPDPKVVAKHAVEYAQAIVAQLLSGTDRPRVWTSNGKIKITIDGASSGQVFTVTDNFGNTFTLEQP